MLKKFVELASWRFKSNNLNDANKSKKVPLLKFF